MKEETTSAHHLGLPASSGMDTGSVDTPATDKVSGGSRMFNVKLSSSEAEMVERFRSRLQARYGNKVRVTLKTVLLEALEQLDKELEEHS